MNDENEKYKALITRMLSGEASSDEQELLEHWLKASAENLALNEQYKAVWQLEPLPSNQHISIDQSAAWHKVKSEIDRLEEHEPTANEPRMLRTTLYILSGVAAILLIFLSIYFLIPRQEQPEMLLHHAEYKSLSPLQLSDGTAVYFREQASLVYPENFTGKQRIVKLTGDAFFEVNHKAGSHFIVDLNGLIIKVLGTSFSITQQNSSNLIDVAVLSGKVLMQTKSAPKEDLILSAGEIGMFNQASNNIIKKEISDLNFLAWKTGRLEFNQTDLPEVISVIESTYQIKVITETDLSDLKLTARFSNEKPEDIFKTISILFGLDIQYDQGFYVVR